MAVLGQQHPLDQVVEALSAALDDAHAASLIGLEQAATADALRALAQVTARLPALTATVLRHAAEVCLVPGLMEALACPGFGGVG